jgi:hypothetical protein
MVAKTKPPAGSAKSGKAKQGKSTRKKLADKTPKQAPIKFSASIEKMESNSRGTKLGLLIPDSHMQAVGVLMQSRLPDTYLEIVVVVRDVKVEKKKSKKPKRGVRRSRFGKYKE